MEHVNCSVSDVATPLPNTDRVAIGGCAGNPANSNAACSTRHVLDNDGLTKRCTHALGHDSSDRVCRAARCKWYDYRDRSRRKRLRPCRVRHGNGSSSCKMQESAAGEVYKRAPLIITLLTKPQARPGSWGTRKRTHL